MSAMRFARIELKNWKNFTSVEVDLAERVFIVGPNASTPAIRTHRTIA